jgi:hypothetical protein
MFTRSVRSESILRISVHFAFPAIMDESREDVPRISVDSLREWHRIKANVTKAALDQFDQRIRQSGLQLERAALLPDVQQVHIHFSIQLAISLPAATGAVYQHDFRKGETQCTNQRKVI